MLKDISYRSILRYAFILALSANASACSKQSTIEKDYKLYDLDGSNQSIIGNGGNTSVENVTLFSKNGDLIFFETRSLSNNIESTKKCSYGFIDTKNGLVKFANIGTNIYDNIINHLKTNGEGAVYRTCMNSK